MEVARVHSTLKLPEDEQARDYDKILQHFNKEAMVLMTKPYPRRRRKNRRAGFRTRVRSD